MAQQWSEPSVRDEDRLPWLESADDDYSDPGAWQRIAALLLAGLLLVAAIAFAVYWFKNRTPVEGAGELIAAPAGDYKVKPDSPGGMKVDGEGETALATSQGKAAPGSAAINLNAAPEAPVVGQKAAQAAAPKVEGNDMAVPASGGRLTAAAPQVTSVRASLDRGSGSLVQLGSFPNEADANAQWAVKSRRFGYLAPLGKSVEKAEVNGRTVYRLRVNAGSADAARTLCAKLKVAGESCFLPS